VLSAGWSLAQAAYLNAGSESVFTDSKKNSCRVTNEEIFDYVNAIYGEPLFKFQAEESLANFLHIRCPNIERSELFQISN
jgi:hypothetical protein